MKDVAELEPNLFNIVNYVDISFFWIRILYFLFVEISKEYLRKILENGDISILRRKFAGIFFLVIIWILKRKRKKKNEKWKMDFILVFYFWELYFRKTGRLLIFLTPWSFRKSLKKNVLWFAFFFFSFKKIRKVFWKGRTFFLKRNILKKGGTELTSNFSFQQRF